MRIAMLAIPGVQMLDLAGPMDVFSEANNLLRDPHPKLVQWVVRESRHVRRVGSVCTGAFVLAHAGLLNGRRATTHWNSTDRLAEMFPAIKLEPNGIFVKDGRTYTTAGVTASMDLALALVEEDHGRSIALRVAKELILFLKRPGGQAQFSMHLEAQVAEMGPIRGIHEWILDNLAADLSVATLAARLGMSSRNFARLFKRETDMTPGDYVEAARVEAARRMIEESGPSLKKVPICAASQTRADYGGRSCDELA